MKTPVRNLDGFPKRLKEGSAEVTIYRQSTPRVASTPLQANGKPPERSSMNSFSPTIRERAKSWTKKTGHQTTLPKFVRQKFGSLDDAGREARIILTKLVNGESEALKLIGLHHAAYVHATQKLREWRPDGDLNASITDYIAASNVRRSGAQDGP